MTIKTLPTQISLTEKEAGYLTRLLENDNRRNLPAAESDFLDRIYAICSVSTSDTVVPVDAEALRDERERLDKLAEAHGFSGGHVARKSNVN